MNAMRCLVFGIVLLLLAGCSSFHSEWSKAAKEPAPAHDITGCWEGTWQNSNNTHQDRMRAILTRVNDTEYGAHFYAKYKKIFSFTYRATFQGTWAEDEFRFHGEEDLGALAGGVYNYEGRASPTNYYSTYSSRYDVGTFTLQRPHK